VLLGYNTNGFAHHRLDDALAILAEAGYRAVALTPDVNHLPPFETDAAELRRLRAALERLELAVVVESGARYVLDSRRKHRPTLLEAEAAGRERRLAFLLRCAQIAAELGGDVISIWAGARPVETPEKDAWRLLADGVERLCREVEPLGVRVAFEPEPGMLLETLEQWTELRRRIDAPNLGLTLDVGHVPCTETISPAEAIRRHAHELVNVHLDDVRGRVHEHLQVGEGDLDWGAIAHALHHSGFVGIASFELSRHSHAAPHVAAEAMRRFQPHLQAARDSD
jgi:L-ribulose-5-phosphate 3-epimerase